MTPSSLFDMGSGSSAPVKQEGSAPHMRSAKSRALLTQSAQQSRNNAARLPKYLDVEDDYIRPPAHMVLGEVRAMLFCGCHGELGPCGSPPGAQRRSGWVCVIRRFEPRNIILVAVHPVERENE